MEILIPLILVLLEYLDTRATRRRIIDWLQQLNPGQKELLSSCLLAAKASRRRSFERPIRRGGPEPFHALCPLLLSMRIVTVESYASKGIRRYRFDSWLYDYLTRHPELLEVGTVPSPTKVSPVRLALD